MADESTYDHDPEVAVTRSLLEAAAAEIRGWKVAKGGDDQVVLNLESILARPAEGIVCSVQTMKTSAGADYYVHLRMADRTITPHVFKIKGRAQYEVAEWKWFFGQGEKPDLLAFDTDGD